ncbi:MAG TPA: HAMP domain-containing sensor histidine kinase [Rhizobacter sp.]
MPRFFRWDRLRRAVCLRACGDHFADLQAARMELADAVALNARLMAERRDTELELRERNLFLGRLSHELRAPLNAIIGFSEILASGGLAPESPKRDQFARHIHTSGRHLLRLINDVLELSKVEAGDHEFFPERVDLGELIARVADLLHTQMVRKSMQLTVDVKAELADIVADPVALKQALLSHLSHAAEIAPEGSGIAVRARLQEPERIRIDIHVSQSTDGNALNSPSVNLMLARRLVEAQGGEAGQSVESGSGTTLYLVLNRFQRSNAASGSLRRQKSRRSVNPTEP